MSEQTIYNNLRAGGLSPAGACAVMGNMYCESLLQSNIVETRCSLGGADYTWNVDNGIITRWQFMSDSYGYGLCQWTFSTRKDNLYNFARDKGSSIGDEEMQCEFCIFELQGEYAGLFAYLRETEDLPEATKRICAEYEQPAVNNFADRINAAKKIYNMLADADPGGCAEDAGQIQPVMPAPIPEGATCQLSVRILKRGDKGRDVFLLQCALSDIGINCGVPDGDFGRLTEAAVKELQGNCGLDRTGTADQDVWRIIFQ